MEDNPFAQPTTPSPSAGAPKAAKGGSSRNVGRAPAPAPAAAPPAAAPARLAAREHTHALVGAPAAAAGPDTSASDRRCFGLIGCARRSCWCLAAVPRSRCATLSSQAFAAVVALALFGLSCYLLAPVTNVGACQDSSCALDNVIPTDCLTVQAAQAGCSNVCATPAANAAAPFWFSASNVAFMSGKAIWCGFPQNNVNWRLPLSFFSSLLTVAASVCVCLKRPAVLVLLAACLFACGCLFLYVMGIDGVATTNGLTLCKGGFAAASGLAVSNKAAALTCEASIFSAVVVLDFALVPILWFAAYATFRHRKFMTGLAPPEPAAAGATVVTGAAAAGAEARGAAGDSGAVDPRTIRFGEPDLSGENQ